MSAQTKYELRWKTLAVLALSLVVIGLDNTILNVALPTLQREFGATGSELQWMVDSYLLVFAGLLLPLGALGDRIGRKKTLSAGLLIFGLASAAAALTDSSSQMIATRAVMGIGGALIMPSTLSIVTDVFPDEERGKAIGIWAGTAAIGIGLGPLIGGALVDFASWQWVFLVNVPVVLAALALGAKLVPDSRDPKPGAADVPGTVFSVGALVSLVYGLIEAPEKGWTSGPMLSAFGIALVLGVAFVIRERRTDSPLLDVGLFRLRAFSLGSVAVSATFFALFGTIFMLTQYLQFVQGADAFEAGLKMTPIAAGLMIGASNADRLAHRFGAARVVSTGMLGVGAALATMLLWEPGTTYWAIAGFLLLLSFSMGNVMAPATASVMGAVPKAKAGVGSAMNDVNRMVAGALGVAGSDSLGAALAVADRLPGAAGDAFAAAAGGAYTDAMGVAALVGALVVVTGAVFVRRLLPSATPAPEQAARSSRRVRPAGQAA
jgi:EmrB/QacA subfamily drug resistance transporter